MGKGWKAAGMAANAAKKGAMFSKFAREIQVAAKLGGPDPATNSRLRMAVDAAKEASCPKDTIERAVKKGAGLLDDASQIEELAYEGFGPHQVGVIVECQTDNRNRTASEIRNIFTKNDGALGAEGSVAWMFDRVATIVGIKAAVADPDEEAIEAGANEVIKDDSDNDNEYTFYANPEDLKAVETALAGRGWKIKMAELGFKAKNMTELNAEQKKEVLEFIGLLDDNDDSHRIYATIEP
jgi:YebC/PmpR family DNA-binding regulatory protein